VSAATPAASRRVAVLAPMPSELRPLLRPLALRRAGPGPGALFAGAIGRVEVVAALTGIGTRAAASATRRILHAAAVDHLVVVGIAGGIGPGVAVGDLVVPERVLDLASGAMHRPAPLGEAPARGTLATSDRLLVDPDEVAGLGRQGVIAIDMETAAIGAVCEEQGCPWSVFRAISDRADDGSTDAAVFGLVGPGGEPKPAAIARFVLTRPWRVPHLVRLGRGLRLATRAAASAAVSALAAL